MLTLASAVAPIAGALLAIAIVAASETRHYLTHRKARPMKYNHARVAVTQQPATRDPLGITAGAILSAVAVGALVPPVLHGGWWWLLLIVTVPAAVLGATGLVLSIPARRRDADGNPIKES